MNVVLSYSLKDYNLAFCAAQTLIQKTDLDPSKLVLYASQHAPNPPRNIAELGMHFTRSTNDSKGYPGGPNMMAAQLFKSIAEGSLGDRVFMIEADGFPTCKDWYNKVLKAHLDTNAWVSGSMVDWVDPKHYNGNLVIDTAFVKNNPVLARPTVQAWDCHHAELLTAAGAANREIHNPRRDFLYFTTAWWKQFPQAWVHGCQNFQMWEEIIRNGLKD